MFNLNQLDISSLPIDTATTLIFYFILGAYTIFSAILYYHWKTYSADPKVTGLTLILYFSSTIPLLIAIGVITLIV